MAKALVSGSRAELKIFTDCMYFINGHCKLNDKCLYRHCRQAATQTNNCFKWPRICRNVNCPYRHPALPSKTENKKIKEKSEITTINPTQPPPLPQTHQDGFITFLWDIENVPIPKAQKPFDIVQRIRQKLVIESGLREYSFTCYCNSTSISKENQLSLFHANVRIVHVPDRKSGAVDLQILLDLDRFERAHRPPASIVLISGDIDFVGKLGDLRHQAGFHVIVIHNKPAKAELKATVHAHYPWELFTQAQQPTAGASNVETWSSVSTIPAPQTYRMNDPKNTGHLHRAESSPNHATPPVKSRPPSAKRATHRCPICTSEFNSVPALRQHQDATDHLFDCPVCDESFVTLDGQTQHQKARDHYPPEYCCFGCNRRFPQFDSLNQHQQATGHNGYIGPVTTAEMDEFLADIVPPSTTSKNNPTNGGFVQNPTASVIQQGIQALVEHLPKMFPSKK